MTDRARPTRVAAGACLYVATAAADSYAYGGNGYATAADEATVLVGESGSRHAKPADCRL